MPTFNLNYQEPHLAGLSPDNGTAIQKWKKENGNENQRYATGNEKLISILARSRRSVLMIGTTTGQQTDQKYEMEGDI